MNSNIVTLVVTNHQRVSAAERLSLITSQVENFQAQWSPTGLEPQTHWAANGAYTEGQISDIDFLGQGPEPLWQFCVRERGTDGIDRLKATNVASLSPRLGTPFHWRDFASELGLLPIEIQD